MKEKNIDFETARLAEKLGFEQPIGIGYRDEGDYYNHLGKLNGDCIRQLKEFFRLRKEGRTIEQANEDNKFNLISAPKLSVLQKWLREEFQMFIVVTPEFYKDGINHCVSVLTYDPNDIMCSNEKLSTGMFGDNGEFNTYEEALEFGLKKGLEKLINRKDI